MRYLFAILALVTASACGPSFIILEIDAPLAIPSETNLLQVVTLDLNQPQTELLNVELPLEEGQAFPIEVLLEPSAETPAELQQRITARLDGVAVARGAGYFTWESHRISRARFELSVIER